MGAVFASDGFTKVLPRQKSIKMTLSKPKRRQSLNMAVKKAVTHATVSDLKKAHDKSAVKKANLIKERGVRAQHRTKLRLLKRKKSSKMSNAGGEKGSEKGTEKRVEKRVEQGVHGTIIHNSASLLPSKSKKQLFEEQNVAIEKLFQRLDDNSNGTLEKSEIMGAALTDPELSKYISPGRAMMLQKQIFVPMTLPMFKEFCNPSNTNKKPSSRTKAQIVPLKLDEAVAPAAREISNNELHDVCVLLTKRIGTKDKLE